MLRRGKTPRTPAPRTASALDPDALQRSFATFIDRRRRWIILALILVAGISALDACAPPASDTTPAVIAARDLVAGRPLEAQDLTTVEIPSPLAGAGAAVDASALIGRVPALTIPTGERVSEAVLVGRGLRPRPGHVLVPVRLADPAVGPLLRAGDRVDLMAGAASASVDAAPADATVLSTNVLIAASPALPSRGGGLVPASGEGLDGGGLVIVDVREQDAARLAGAASWARISVLLRPSGEQRTD